jgi:hypothetical protein
LGISDVHLAFYKTGRLIEWWQRNEKLTGEINEDALFWLSVAMPERIGKIKYYLEYDTGTEPLWQIDEKLNRYIELRRRSSDDFRIMVWPISAA